MDSVFRTRFRIEARHARAPDQVSNVTARAVQGPEPGEAGPATVSWTRVSGAGISEYRVTATDGVATLGPFSAPGARDSLDIPARSLGPMDEDAGGDWSFTVQAVSTSELLGPVSGSSEKVDLFSVPSVPMALPRPGDRSVTFRLSVGSTGGRPIEFLLNEESVQPPNDSPSVGTKRIDGLTNGKPETYTVGVRQLGGNRKDGAPLTVIPHSDPVVSITGTQELRDNVTRVDYQIEWNGSLGTCEFLDGNVRTRCDGTQRSQEFSKSSAGPHPITLFATNGEGDSSSDQRSYTVQIPTPAGPTLVAAWGGECNNFSGCKWISVTGSDFVPNSTVTLMCWGYHPPAGGVAEGWSQVGVYTPVTTNASGGFTLNQACVPEEPGNHFPTRQRRLESEAPDVKSNALALP